VPVQIVAVDCSHIPVDQRSPYLPKEAPCPVQRRLTLALRQSGFNFAEREYYLRGEAEPFLVEDAGEGPDSELG
jgi:hypothetical protein